jgi:uncharacterized damage-inducible protein DinB
MKEELMRLSRSIACTGFVVVLAVPAVPLAAAQSKAPAAAAGNPISDAIRDAWSGAKRNLTESAEQMPEPDYAFKPTEQVRTFGQILAHVAGANYVFCSTARGEKSPFEEDQFEKNAKTKAEIVKALNDSITYCDGAYTALTDRSAGETVTMPFNMGTKARGYSLILNAGHLQEHYGNLVTYFRIKGMVPPSSKRQ